MGEKKWEKWERWREKESGRAEKGMEKCEVGCVEEWRISERSVRLLTI
jgi:hypothetical protein